ncbi:unnamed protein product [Mucor hiemalis]
MVKSYISGKNKRESTNIYFAVLKYSTLYLYDSEKQLDCKGVINLNNHKVKTHPPGLQDFELFSKPHLIKLENTDNGSYFVNCNRCIDKEDWFFALIRASKLPLTNQPQPHQHHDKTHFDQVAMNHLITMVHSDEHHFQTQWLNAILGRIFFGVYRTQDVKDALYKKVMSKLDKINSKRPPFLGEITVRSVDPGHSLPRFTQPKLLGLSPTGELTAEAHMQYDGGFRIEISTELKWKYSDRLRPLTMDIVLGITLKEIEGKLLIKIKEPPTNRFWYGFYECPKMEWKVEPVVWEKQIGYSVVVKAIQTKIQEFIMETMVLPNFDDITFFPTNGVGGIFEVSPDEAAETATETTSEEIITNNIEKETTNNAKKAESSTIIENSISATKKLKREHKERQKNDEALLTTAKSLPELFSAVPDRQQQQQQTSKLRTQHQYSDNDTNKSEPIYHYGSSPSASLLSSSPITTHSIISNSNNISCSPRLIPADDTVPGQIAISNSVNTNNDSTFVGSFLSTSPDSLSSSPSSGGTVDDSLRTLTHVLTDETNIIVSPSTSSTLVTCDSAPVQITYSQDYTTNIDSVTSSNEQFQKNARLRKSSSLALLRPKTGASTAINVLPAMAHKQFQEKKDVDSVSVAVVSI